LLCKYFYPYIELIFIDRLE
jgi:MFS family permease